MQTSLSLLVFKEQKPYPTWDTRILAEVEVFFQCCKEIEENCRIGVGKYSFPTPAIGCISLRYSSVRLMKENTGS